MLTLYLRPTCHYCVKVLHVAEELGLEVEQKNIGDTTIAQELIKRGGKQQVPYLVDTDCSVEMYESEDIMRHLRSEHSENA